MSSLHDVYFWLWLCCGFQCNKTDFTTTTIHSTRHVSQSINSGNINSVMCHYNITNWALCKVILMLICIINNMMFLLEVILFFDKCYRIVKGTFITIPNNLRIVISVMWWFIKGSLCDQIPHFHLRYFEVFLTTSS